MFNRIRLRAFLNRQSEDCCKKALRDRALFEELFAGLTDEYEAYCKNASGPLQDFFTWLLANGPAIIAFITQLIALFP